jgi:bacteriocin-like protein
MKRDQRRPRRKDKDLQPPKSVKQLDDKTLEQVTGGTDHQAWA